MQLLEIRSTLADSILAEKRETAANFVNVQTRLNTLEVKIPDMHETTKSSQKACEKAAHDIAFLRKETF